MIEIYPVSDGESLTESPTIAQFRLYYVCIGFRDYDDEVWCSCDYYFLRCCSIEVAPKLTSLMDYATKNDGDHQTRPGFLMQVTFLIALYRLIKFAFDVHDVNDADSLVVEDDIWRSYPFDQDYLPKFSLNILVT